MRAKKRVELWQPSSRLVSRLTQGLPIEIASGADIRKEKEQKRSQSSYQQNLCSMIKPTLGFSILSLPRSRPSTSAPVGSGLVLRPHLLHQRCSRRAQAKDVICTK